MAEVAAGRSCGQNEMVVAVAAVVEDHLLVLGIDVIHFPHQDLDVFGFPQHHPQGGGHIGLGDQARSHLIKQGLEQVEVAPVDQGDANGLPRQDMGRPQPGKPTAHDHHMGCGSEQFRRRGQLEKKAFGSHRPAGADFKLSTVFKAGFSAYRPSRTFTDPSG